MVSCPYCGNQMTSSRTDGSYYCSVCQRVFYPYQDITYGSTYTIPLIPYHKFTNTATKSIQIECDTISLKHKGLDIEVPLDHAINDIETITINGIKFVREK